MAVRQTSARATSATSATLNQVAVQIGDVALNRKARNGASLYKERKIGEEKKKRKGFGKELV